VSVAGLVEYAAALSNACGHEVNIHRNARPDKPAVAHGGLNGPRQRREPFDLNGLASLWVVLGCEFAPLTRGGLWGSPESSTVPRIPRTAPMAPALGRASEQAA